MTVKLMAQEEAVIDYNNEGQLIRDPFGIFRPNARSAVGITKKGDVIFLLFAQNPEASIGKGFTFQQMAEVFKTFDVEKAMALDGGSSSSMVVNGQTYWAKYNKSNEPVQRRVKSVLMIVPTR